MKYKNLRRGAIFSPSGKDVVCVKHSNAVAFDLQGNDHIFSLFDEVIVREVPKQDYFSFIDRLKKQDLLYHNIAIKQEV